MHETEKDEICRVIRNSPRTIWGYLPFVLPVIIVVMGIAINVALLAYFKYTIPGLELCLRRGEIVESLGGSELFRRVVLTTLLSIVATFALLALLARLTFRQVKLLRMAASELGICEDDESASDDARP